MAATIASDTSTATTRATCGAIALANVPVPAPKSTTVLLAPTPRAWSTASSSVQSGGDFLAKSSER